MPYIILADKDQEIDRRELSEAVTIGRSLECGIQVRDALLSRQHCRLEPIGTTWVLTDLNSRNGTFLSHDRVTQHVLEEGDVLRIGRVRLCFRAGPFVAAPQQTTYSKMMRPSDPVEALSGTVMGFVVTDVDMEEESRISGFPIPKPQPAEPAAYKRDKVHAMVAQMASTSWDSATESGKPKTVARTLPQPMIKPQRAVEKQPKTKSPQPAQATTPAKREPILDHPKEVVEPKRPLHRACAWLAIGAAAAIYIISMYVIIQA
ncbi:MAG: FHA domain-containing protein [Anaerolineae bacterium]|nr:FHA domain-containing protein [Phycisphaerae bacterium]